MSVFDKPFDELTDDEIAELEATDWTPGQILRAISMARDMEAVVSLLHRVAVKDPEAAGVIVTAIKRGAL